ncbi:MAG TPA: RHS repeat-associated core domain-containing protein [Fimbriimonadaceae bacterium]|nr:RHS repeat-associated core domain-containing protein [Fimbriimonadaceae bacterium]
MDAIASSTDVYTYDPGDKLQEIRRNGLLWRDYAYDAQGRTTAIAGPGGGYNFNYDDADRIVDLTSPSGTDSFGYNGLNTRVQASWNGSPVQDFLRDGVGVTAPVLRDGDAGYTPGISRHTPLGVVRTHGALKNEHTQWGITGTSPPALTVSAERDYDAFGRTISTAGTWAGPFAYAGGFGYQSSSPDYDFQLLGHRYYDPETGRFLTRDPIKDGRNWWVYCESNPLTGVDPEGLAVFLAPVIWKGAIVVGAALLTAIDVGTAAYDIYNNPRDLSVWGFAVAGIVDPTPGNLGKHGIRLGGRLGKKPGSSANDALSEDIIPGTYLTTGNTGRPYVGQSSNIDDRFNKPHHQKPPGEPMDVFPMPGSSLLDRLIAEQTFINHLGGVGSGKLDNVRNPIKEADWEKYGIPRPKS